MAVAKAFLRILSLLLIAVILASCGGTGIPAEKDFTKPTDEVIDVVALPKDKVYQILFIGNSYTYYNDMPTVYFQKIAEACGYKIQVTTVTKGGYKLSKHADPADPYGERVAAYLSVSGLYDYVILQEQSVLPATDPEAFYASVRNLAERIRAVGAKPVLYATWGRKEGCEKLTEIGMTNESMTWSIMAAYVSIGKELDIPVVPVGLAFLDVNTNADIELYDPDMSHPSAYGSYLAAMSLFSGIFGVVPDETSYKGNFTTEEARVLCEAAKKAVFLTPEIPG